MAEMVMELYRTKETMEEVNEAVQQVAQSDVHRGLMLKQLKFKSLSKAEKSNMRLTTAQVLWPELLEGAVPGEDGLGFDFNVWAKFLPTRSSIKKYTYDSVPFDVLRHIFDAKSLQIFDKIEIWTPEGNTASGRIERMTTWGVDSKKVVDPMAVGVITTRGDGVRHYFSIARWGESLEPFEKIKAYVQKVDRQIVLRRLAGPAVIFLGSLFALLFAGSPFLAGATSNEVGIVVILGVAGGVVSTCMMLYRALEQRFYLLGSQYHRRSN